MLLHGLERPCIQRVHHRNGEIAPQLVNRDESMLQAQFFGHEGRDLRID